MSDYPVNIAITDTFSHYLLTTGLANAAFTKLLYKDGEVLENLFTNTSEFDNAAWTKVASSISANAVAEPLGGTLAGDKIV